MATTSIQGLMGYNPVSDSTSTNTANAFDMNAFLTMFVTQLKYQDPTSPLESYQLASQLAQFTSVEKLTQASTSLKDLKSYSTAINNAEMVSLVGKDVLGQRNTVDVTSSSVGTLGFSLDSSLSDLTLNIKDSTGATVYTDNWGTQDAGDYTITWDGNNSSGTRVANGTYTIELKGTASDNSSKTVTTTTSGTVASVALDESNPYFMLSDGSKMLAADVMKILNASAANTASTGTSSATGSTSKTGTSTSTSSGTSTTQSTAAAKN